MPHALTTANSAPTTPCAPSACKSGISANRASPAAATLASTTAPPNPTAAAANAHPTPPAPLPQRIPTSQATGAARKTFIAVYNNTRTMPPNASCSACGCTYAAPPGAAAYTARKTRINGTSARLTANTPRIPPYASAYTATAPNMAKRQRSAPAPHASPAKAESPASMLPQVTKDATKSAACGIRACLPNTACSVPANPPKRRP